MYNYSFPYLCIASGIIEPVIKGDDMKEYLTKHINPTLIKGLTELCKQKPQEPLVRNHSYNYMYNS